MRMGWLLSKFTTNQVSKPRMHNNHKSSLFELNFKALFESQNNLFISENIFLWADMLNNFKLTTFRMCIGGASQWSLGWGYTDEPVR